jgi:F-type H+-transporting ATPase subunit delta
MSVAKKYAKALFDESRKNGAGTTDYAVQLRAMQSLLDSHKDLRAALTAPVTSGKEKMAIVQDIAAKAGFAKLTVNFLKLVAENGRLGILGEIIDALDEVRLASEGGVMGRIVSAEPLEAGALKQISDAFSQKLKKKVDFKVTTDGSLLAGLKVTVQGVTYDGTLRSQLDRLKEEFVGGAAVIR